MFAGRSQRVEHGREDPPLLDGPLAQRLARIRRRLKALMAIDGAVTGAAIAATTGALVVAWCRWRATAPSARTLAAIVLAGAVVGAVVRASRRISWAACARLVDQVLDGEDRVLSAVWLADAPSPLAQAAVADAVARTERLDPRAAVPTRRPSGARALAFGAAVLAIAWLVPGGTRAARLPAPEVSRRSATAPLPSAALDAERTAVALARARAERSEDAALRTLAAALDRLVRGLSEGTVDEAAALEALRVLDQQAGASAEAAARDAQVLRAAAKALAASAATRDVGEALRRDGAAGSDAASALGSSAARQPAATAAALRAAGEAVSQAAADSSEAGSARRRLRRDDPGASAASGGGERARGDERRKLEQLSRDLDQAGASCERGGPDCRSRAESSGRQLGELQSKASAEPALRDLERATRQLHDRIARGDLRNGESEAARSFARAAAGGHPTPSGNGTPAAGSSDDGAGEGRPQATAAGAAGMGTGTPGGAAIEATEATAGADDEQSAAGGGIGHENGGAPLAGRESVPGAPGRDARVPTADGAGPSRAKVIDGAAGRGFASRPYANVYSDYRAAVEEALGASAVPPGQQYVVRRYFDLIRPRSPAGGRP
ncbi:MAG: hypothetical protein ACJ8F1_15020 [Polyangia bacterium]